MCFNMEQKEEKTLRNLIDVSVSFGHCIVCPYDLQLIITPLVSSNLSFTSVNVFFKTLYYKICLKYYRKFQVR